MTEPTPLNYAPRARVSRIAVASFVIGIVSVPLFFLVVPAVIAVVFAVAAGHTLRKSPTAAGGMGFVKAGGWLGAGSLFLLVAFILFLPSARITRGLSNRSYCAANLRGIMQSMNVYAAINDDGFPSAAYAPYTAALNNPVSSVAPTKEAAAAAIYSATAPNLAGSPPAALWLLAVTDFASPFQFVCKSDPFPTSPATLTSGGDYHTNFSGGGALSYSVAYPYTADGRPGPWWKALTDSSLPIISDMAPLQGTGTPARVLNPASAPRDNKTWNSANHGGEGQNVGFSDAHAEWFRTPAVGHDNDNIFTTTGTGAPAQFGGTPATPLFPLTPPLPASATKFDVIFVPVRNATTGAM